MEAQQERTKKLADYPDALSVEQVCEILNICRTTAYKLVRTGELEAVRIGRLYRISKYSIKKFMKHY